MKFNVLRNLLLPWLVFFVFAFSFSLYLQVEMNLRVHEEPLFLAYLGISSLLCFVFNVRTLRAAGIWIAYSLPLSIRFSAWPWLFRAVAAVLVTAISYKIGEEPWMPLLWKGIITPTVAAIGLYFFARSLVGVVLRACANLLLGRTLAFALSIPIFLIVPASVLVLGGLVANTYWESRGMNQESLSLGQQQLSGSAGNTSAAAITTSLSETELKLQSAAETPETCAANKTLILSHLSTHQPSPLVLQALKGLRCTENRTVVATQKLLDLILGHSSGQVRAAALSLLPYYGTENLRRISYLLFKKISDKEEAQVVQAAAKILAPLGDLERAFVKNRLVILMNGDVHTLTASRILTETLKEEELVLSWISARLNLGSEASPRQNQGEAATRRAIGMICSVSEGQRKQFEPAINSILAAVKEPSLSDFAVQALHCLGESALVACTRELKEPLHISRKFAARILAGMKLPADSELMRLFEACAKDKDAETGKWCSVNLAKMGSPAIPSIVELLRSKDPLSHQAGKQALESMKDPSAKEALLTIRSMNSGWLANQDKLEVARAAQSALNKLQLEIQSDSSSQSIIK